MPADQPRRRTATEEAFAILEQLDRYRALAQSTWSSADDEDRAAIYVGNAQRAFGIAAPAPAAS